MRALRLYLLAALPALVCAIAWIGGSLAIDHLHCSWHGKDLGGCIAFGVDVGGLLGLAIFWGMIGIVPATFVSVILLAAVPTVVKRTTHKKAQEDAPKSAPRPPRFPNAVVVASGFVAVVAVMAGIGYLLRDVPTEEERCKRLCAVTHRSSQLVPVYPSGGGPMRCECL